MRYRYAPPSVCFTRAAHKHMNASRHLARKYLKHNEIPFTMTSFPRMGVPGVFTEPYFDPVDAVSSHSLFLPEEITNPHARFPSVFLPLAISPRLNLGVVIGHSPLTSGGDAGRKSLSTSRYS